MPIARSKDRLGAINGVLKTNIRFTPSIIGGNIMIRLIIALVCFGTLGHMTKEGLKQHLKVYDEHIRR